MLGYYDVGNPLGIGLIRVTPLPRILSIIDLVPMDEQDYIGILLNAAALPQVREQRDMRGA